MPSNVRLNFVVNQHVKDRLQRLSVMLEDISYTEVVRRALIAYEALLLADERGEKLVLEGEESREVIKILERA